jgi:hypothetical protein
MPKRQSRPRKPKLLIDELTPSLEERCLAQLRQGLPPDADEFDRVCFEAMANYVNLEAELRARAEGTANDKRMSYTQSTFV